MPVFRELWGWCLFTVLAILSTVAAILTTPPGSFWEVFVAVGKKVEYLWIASAIFSYVVQEGANMLAEKYLKRRFAEGKAEGEDAALSAIREAAQSRGLDPQEIQRVIDDTREIMRRGQNGS